MLAGATRDYLAEMRTVEPQSTAEDRAFLQYMIVHEATQLMALEHAAGQRYAQARGELGAFLRNRQDHQPMRR
jgi:hypothetical protein